MIYQIPISEDDILVAQVKEFYAFQEDVERSVKKCAKNMDISVLFCDNTLDLAKITVEDLIIARISSPGSVR